MEYKFVSFDLADGSFNFYTQVEWDNVIAAARKELMAQHPDWEKADVYELLEAMCGEEFFWEEID